MDISALRQRKELPGVATNSKNHLFILRRELEESREVTGLAKGERIYSVRFMGDKAYIVTLKETDPTFCNDTSNREIQTYWVN